MKTVKDIMTIDVHSISSDKTVYDAKEICQKYHHRHLPVTKKGELVGIITMNDILRLSFGDTYLLLDGDPNSGVFDQFTVEMIMSSKVVTVEETSTLEEVSKIFIESEFHALPVVSNTKNLVGIVTTTDVIKAWLS